MRNAECRNATLGFAPFSIQHSEFENSMNIEVKVWGKTPDNKDIKLYTLTNANGVKVQLSDIGAGPASGSIHE